MVTLKCEAANCGEIKSAVNMATCVALMQFHQKNVHDAPTDGRQKPPEICRPTLRQGIAEEHWEVFARRWNMFRKGTRLTTGQVTDQLLACCEPELEAALFREDPYITDMGEADILVAMKRLAVLSVALSVRRAALLQTRQDPGEHVRQFVSRLRGLADVCHWTRSGPCSAAGCTGSAQVDYTDDIVKLVLLNGLADDDIRKDMLGTAGIDAKSLNDTVALIDSEETAARAVSADGHRVADTTYRKAKRGPPGTSLLDQDEARSEATFSFSVANFSKLKTSMVSPPCFIRNLPWKIMVMPCTDPGLDRKPLRTLDFFLQCNTESESASWSCLARAEYRLLSVKDGVEDYNQKTSHLFNSKESDWGFSDFMTWNEVLDEHRGYIKNDTITLQVKVNADAPHGISWDSKKHRAT